MDVNIEILIHLAIQNRLAVEKNDLAHGFGLMAAEVNTEFRFTLLTIGFKSM